MLICYDGGFYEIYDKDEREAEALHAECLRNGFGKIALTTDGNDGRSCFHF